MGKYYRRKRETVMEIKECVVIGENGWMKWMEAKEEEKQRVSYGLTSLV